MARLLLKGGRLIDPELDRDKVGDLLIENGKIAAVGEGLSVDGVEVIDCTGKIVTPGLFDMHVHLREPGEEYKETIASGSAAAAHGGFTGIAAMPNTKPPLDNGAKLRFVVERAKEQAAVKVYPMGAITKGLKGETLAEMADMKAEGAVAFTDDGKGIQNPLIMRRALEYAKVLGSVLALHEEDELLLDGGCVNEGLISTRLGLPGSPALAEALPIMRDIELAKLTGGRIHVMHVSTKLSVEAIRRAKAEGVNITAEVTPHHLVLTEDDLDNGYNTNFKMNPPLRSEEDRQALIAGLLDGTLDVIASDHAPHAPQEKQLEFELARYGTTGLETMLPVLLDRLVTSGILDYTTLLRALTQAPRAILGLTPVRLEEGCAADVTVIDPACTVNVTEDWFVSKAKNSAFLGQTYTGCATEAVVDGKLVLRAGGLCGSALIAAQL